MYERSVVHHHDIVDAQLTQRERTPSPCLSDYTSSPCLSLPGSGSPSLSPLDTDTPGPVRDSSRTRRAARCRERSEGSSAGSSLRSSSSTGQLLDQQVPLPLPAAITYKSGSVGHLLTDDVTTSQSFTDAEYQLHGSVSSETARSATQCQNDSKQTQQCASASSETDTLKQMSEHCVNHDQSRSSSHSKTASSSSSASSTGKSGKARRQPSHKTTSQRGVRSRPSTAAVTQSTRQRSTTTTSLNNTAPTSLTNSLTTSMSADSEKLLKEFDAIKKLKLFAGLGRHGRKSAGSKVQRADSGLRGGHEVETKQFNMKPSCAAVRSRTGNTVATATRTATAADTATAALAAAKLPKSSSTNSGESKQPLTGQTTSPSGLTVDGAKSRKPGQKAASKWSL